jgi:hypothetical protein
MSTTPYRFQISTLPEALLDLKSVPEKIRAMSIGKYFVGASCNKCKNEFILHFDRELVAEENEGAPSEVDLLHTEVRSWDFRPLPSEDEESA